MKVAVIYHPSGYLVTRPIEYALSYNFISACTGRTGQNIINIVDENAADEFCERAIELISNTSKEYSKLREAAEHYKETAPNED